LKGWLRKWKTAAKTIWELALAVENAANFLHHRSKRCLYGKNACTRPLMLVVLHDTSNILRLPKLQVTIPVSW
jgi:hypothetical protein